MPILQTTDCTSPIYQAAVAIRTAVFIDEQQIDPALELDDQETACSHFVLYLDDMPVATCRLLPLSATTVKLQRMAVLKDYRKQQLGAKLMQAAEQFAKQAGYQTVVLGAQKTAQGFYQALGYEAYGEPFLDADLPHIMMQKELQ